VSESVPGLSANPRDTFKALRGIGILTLCSAVSHAINFGGTDMPLGTILLIILVLLLIGALPTWGYSAAWGPFPAGILGVILVVVLILVLLGRI